MTEQDTGILTSASAEENTIRQQFQQLFKQCPIPEEQILSNLGLFLSSKNLARILFMNHIYEKIVKVHGVVMEFGTRWGQNASLFTALRGIYEPFNRHRKVIVFDTFNGFLALSAEDGQAELMNEGMLSVTDNYQHYLEEVLTYQEADNPAAHLKKYEIVAGDATETLPQYLLDNSETIVALAYFDFDLYQPTKVCLQQIKERLVKGSVLAFDELCDHESPGETLAVLEVLGLNNLRLQRCPYASRTSYAVIE